MSTRVVSTINIAATPAEVFIYLEDLKLHYVWNPQIEKITPVAKLKKGMSYKAVRTVLGQEMRTKNIVTKLVKDELLRLENTAGLIHYCVSYELSIDEDGSTLVTCDTEISNESPAFSFAKPMLKVLAKKELHTDLKALKKAVEKHLK